jgi:hypothetical protein
MLDVQENAKYFGVWELSLGSGWPTPSQATLVIFTKAQNIFSPAALKGGNGAFLLTSYLRTTCRVAVQSGISELWSEWYFLSLLTGFQ